MEKRIIAGGLLAGAVGGLLAFVFARTFVEPVISRAIELEDHDHGPELFSRAVQANVGMGFGLVAFGVALGALTAVVFAVVYGRTSLGSRGLALVLAAAAFGTVSLVPFLKYPPNPPAVGHEETLQQRTGLYLLTVVLSVALAVAAVWLGRRLRQRLGLWSAGVLAAGGYVLVVSSVMLALPSFSETPEGFPADLLYDFRLYSLGTQFVMWGAIGVVFAAAVGRLLPETAGSQGAVSTAAVAASSSIDGRRDTGI